ncbi:MAG: putative DNA-binding transcriptional regulator AlpA, partial [Porticoccaceae bacterium]
DFPSSVNLSARIVVWNEADISDWLDQKFQAGSK